MRSVYLVTQDAVATTSDKDFQRGSTDIGSGLMLDAEGRTVGFDLYVEIERGKWVMASELPKGMLSEEKRRGTLQAGILYDGRVYNRLNINNIHDKLIASKNGLQLKSDEYKGGSTAFKAQITDPMAQLASQIDALRTKIEELKTLESEERKAFLEVLPGRIKTLRKEAVKLEEEEEEEPHITTTQLEALVRAQLVNEAVERQGPLLLDPAKMRALRSLLLSS